MSAVDGKRARNPLRRRSDQADERCRDPRLASHWRRNGDDHGRRRAHGQRHRGKLGIDEVIAGVLPDGKVDALERLREAQKIAFVGDGVNDAPALAAADAGIAIGTGTDIAIEAADVVLMSGDLAKVPAALAISRATMRNISQNLFWAFAYNVVLIPVAAGALYPVNGTLLVADARRRRNGALERLRADQCACACVASSRRIS